MTASIASSRFVASRAVAAVGAEHRLPLLDRVGGQQPVEGERDLDELVGSRAASSSGSTRHHARIELVDLENRNHLALEEHRVASGEQVAVDQIAGILERVAPLRGEVQIPVGQLLPVEAHSGDVRQPLEHAGPRLTREIEADAPLIIGPRISNPSDRAAWGGSPAASSSLPRVSRPGRPSFGRFSRLLVAARPSLRRRSSSPGGLPSSGFFISPDSGGFGWTLPLGPPGPAGAAWTTASLGRLPPKLQASHRRYLIRLPSGHPARPPPLELESSHNTPRGQRQRPAASSRGLMNIQATPVISSFPRCPCKRGDTRCSRNKISTAGSQPAAVRVRRPTRTENHPPHAYHGYAPTRPLSHPKPSNTTNSLRSTGGPESGSDPWVVRSSRRDLAQGIGEEPGPAPAPSRRPLELGQGSNHGRLQFRQFGAPGERPSLAHLVIGN